MNRCPGCKRPNTAKGRNYCRPCGADYQRVRRALIRANLPRRMEEAA